MKTDELTVEELSSALAISEGYNPNDFEPGDWPRIQLAYQKKAQKVMNALEGSKIAS